MTTMPDHTYFAYCPAPVYADGSDASDHNIKAHLLGSDRGLGLTKAFADYIDGQDYYYRLSDMGLHLSDDQVSEMETYADTGEFDSHIFYDIAQQLVTVLSIITESASTRMVHPATPGYTLLGFIGLGKAHELAPIAEFIYDQGCFNQPLEKKD